MCKYISMVIEEYLKKYDLRLYPWAKANGITPEIISLYRSGKRGLSAQTMAKIVAATGGEVSYEDLVAEMQERQEARKNGNVG